MLEFTIWHQVAIVFFGLSWASWFLIEAWFAGSEPFFLGTTDRAKHWIMYKGVEKIFTTWNFWLTIIFASLTVMFADLMLRFYMKVRYYDKEECIKDMYGTAQLDMFLDKLKKAREAHAQKSYNPEVGEFKGYAPTH